MKLKLETQKLEKSAWIKQGALGGLFLLAVLVGVPATYAAAPANSVPVHRMQTTPAQNTRGAYGDPFGAFQNGMTGWNPFAEMAQMHRMMQNMFESQPFAGDMMMHPAMSGSTTTFEPRLDVDNLPAEYVIRADVPGMQKDKLDVSIQNGYLTLSGERRYSHDEEQNGKVQWSERSYGTFQRTLPLPQNVKTDKISAKYEDGVLTIHLPKIHPEKVAAPAVKQIPIQ